MGYNVKILVGDLLDFNSSSQKELFLKYNLSEKIIIQDYKIPTNKVYRVLKGFFLAVSHINLFFYIIKYYRQYSKFSFTYLYELIFFSQFREVENLHVQFGTNKHPIDFLKMIGFLKGKLIVSFHGHDLYFPINGRIDDKDYYKNLFIAGDYFIANTPYLKKNLLSLGAEEDKIRIIPVGVDDKYFKPKKHKELSDYISLVTVGRLETFKGQKLGVECVKNLILKGCNIRYTIVGNGREYNNLNKLIKTHGLDDKIFLTGAKNQADIKAILLNSDIFLMTSITDPNYGVESQGLVTAEAQSCGLPVVAFDSGGIKYTLEDGETGFLCKEYNLDCYTDKLEMLINNPELRNTMGANARKFISTNFSQNSLNKKWDKIYS